MGGCTSKSTATFPVPHEVQIRRLRRQNSSQEDMQRQLDAYHRRPRSVAQKVEKVRPAPILIENPASLDESKLGNAMSVSSLDSDVSLGSAVHSSNSSMACVELD